MMYSDCEFKLDHKIPGQPIPSTRFVEGISTLDQVCTRYFTLATPRLTENFSHQI